MLANNLYLFLNNLHLPQICIARVAAGPGDHWCGKTHNENEYTSDDVDALVAMGHSASNFVFDSKNGWRLCQATLDECKQACETLGECAELNVAGNGCCFFGPTHCVGTERSNDQKYLVVACSPPPPSRPSRAPRGDASRHEPH